MTRWLIAASVALVLIGSAGLSAAQEHGGRGAAHRGQTTGPPPQAPSPSTTTGHFASTQTFEPRPVHVRPVPSPFTFPILWRWDVAMPAQAFAAGALAPPPENAPIGGLQLDVQPWRAQVYVDGAYAGLVDEFTGYYHHLHLIAGSHLIAIVKPDYQPLIIDVMVLPGHTTTYRGALTRTLDR